MNENRQTAKNTHTQSAASTRINVSVSRNPNEHRNNHNRARAWMESSSRGVIGIMVQQFQANSFAYACLLCTRIIVAKVINVNVHTKAMNGMELGGASDCYKNLDIAIFTLFISISLPVSSSFLLKICIKWMLVSNNQVAGARINSHWQRSGSQTTKCPDFIFHFLLSP